MRPICPLQSGIVSKRTEVHIHEASGLQNSVDEQREDCSFFAEITQDHRGSPSLTRVLNEIGYVALKIIGSRP